jgi:hypothetical protein
MLMLMLTISEPKRIRSKEHLRFVAQQSCLVYGCSPSHTHQTSPGRWLEM